MPNSSELAFDTAVGNRMRELRIAANLTQAQVSRRAAAAGIAWPQSSVATIEAGRRSLTAYEWLALPAIYRCSPAVFESLRPSGPTDPAAVRFECDAKAAATLGVGIPWVVEHSVRLWGRSLAEERDARSIKRIQHLGVPDRSRGAQSARGHVTRVLVAELAAQLRA